MHEMASPDTGRLLLVDDDERYLRSLEALIASHGFDVQAVHSGTQAIELLRREAFDVVVLDLNMPGVGGVEILGFLATDTHNVKSIVVSGEASPARIAPVLRHGASDYLLKPCPPSQLIASIKNQIARKRLEDENETMQERIEQSDQLHRYLVNQSPDVIYMLDEEGRFTFLNSKVNEVFGCDRTTLLGQHWTALFDAEDESTARYRFDERRTGTRATRHHEMRARPLGTNHERYLEVTSMGIWRPGVDGTPVFAGTYGVARDVTARRATALALAESQRKFYSLFQSSPDAIFISRLTDGVVLEGNASFRALSDGQQRRGASSADSDAFLWPTTSARALFVDRLARMPEHVDQELVLELAHGPHHLQLATRLLVVEGDECMLGTLRDLTTAKRAERERLALENQLQEARKLEAIGQLAGGIAHDFNNILASMIGYTELAAEAGPRIDEAKRRSYLDQVIDAGQRARDLIAQMLSFSRTNRDNAAHIDLGREMEHTLRMLRAAIPTTIDIDYLPAIPALPAVFMDPVHLQQVLINLFVNARDAIAAVGAGVGKITLAARCRPEHGVCVSCGGAFEGEWVTLEVSDTGGGIATDLLPRIFDRFVTSRESGQGTGIGLAVVHSFVHEYGGHVQIEAPAGGGTLFKVLLPRSAETPRATSTAASTALALSFGGVGRILVVDDEASVGNMMAETLRSAGYEVVLYNDAVAAWDYIESRSQELDLVVTDQTMPRLSGLELSARVKRIPAAPPVVLVTGYQDTARARAVGVEHVLLKPFSLAELLNVAREMTTDRRARAGIPASPFGTGYVAEPP